MQEVFHPYNLLFFSNNEFVTTVTELNAIAAPANTGDNSPNAAIGIPIQL